MAAAVGAAAAALALVLSACGSDSSSTSSEGSTASGNSIADKAKNDKELNIGVKPDQPGLGLQSSSGEYSGFDVDVATYVANKLGAAKINFVPTLSANREAFLQQGKVDMVVATYSITPERQKVVAFAGPYYVAHQDILVRANDNSIKQADDLKGKKVCSGQGSASGDRIEEQYGSAVPAARCAASPPNLPARKPGHCCSSTTSPPPHPPAPPDPPPSTPASSRSPPCSASSAPTSLPRPPAGTAGTAPPARWPA
ncbi:MAG TPA: transporter substrate-binding domain-containing protein [Streptosporangiaceae bacterium]|nr:transporter substrate-binding domain-containing protein [Streptosporangiaceae bacterium]